VSAPRRVGGPRLSGPGAARTGAACALLLFAGCAAVRSVPAVRSYRLAYPPPEPARAVPLPVTIRVIPFGIAAAFDQPSFVYRTGPYDVGVDYYNRWVASPASMITDLIARDLVAARDFVAVLQEPSAMPTDYELNGQIGGLEERDEGGTCTAHLSLRAVLVRVPRREPRTVVMQDEFSADESCQRGSPEAFVAAMSRAAQQVSEHLRTAILTAIQNQ